MELHVLWPLIHLSWVYKSRLGDLAESFTLDTSKATLLPAKLNLLATSKKKLNLSILYSV